MPLAEVMLFHGAVCVAHVHFAFEALSFVEEFFASAEGDFDLYEGFFEVDFGRND